MPSLGPPPALYRALAESLSTGSFIDTKFYVFSRRSSDGRVDRPRVLYANGSILKERSTYFDAMLTSGFSEAEAKDMAGGFPNDAIPYIDDYDYGSDSDLEDGGEDYDDAEEELGPESSTGDHNKGKATGTCPGTVIVIRDAAFLTFQAVLVFLHTGEVLFEEPKKDDAARYDNKTQPSAKSVYRLADKYGLDELKALAFENIRKEVTLDTATNDAFSTFASWYPELNNLYIEEMARGFKQGADTVKATQNLMSKVDSFSRGELPHACEAFICFSNTLASISTHKPTEREVESATSRPSPQNWGDLKKAILNAIRGGRFIDSRIQAYSGHSISHGWELYFSKAALGLVYSQLVRLRRTTNKESLDSDTKKSEDAENNSDFDDEDFSASNESGVELQVPGADMPEVTPDKCSWEKANLKAPMKTRVGAFTSWKAALYYIYTEDVSFARPKSQKTESQDIDQLATPSSPFIPICSPKSMHAVAGVLKLSELQNLCEQDIISKVGPDNVVEETFSRFSSANASLLEMQTQALFTHYNIKDVVGFLNERLRAVSAKPTSHYSAALQSILAQIMQKSRRPVLLYCTQNSGHSGTKAQWRRDEECPTCDEKEARCESCGHVAHYMKVFDDAVACPKCKTTLKEE